MSSGVTRYLGTPANSLSVESPPSLAKGPWAPSYIPPLPSTFDVAAYLAGGQTGPPQPPGKCQAARHPRPTRLSVSNTQEFWIIIILIIIPRAIFIVLSIRRQPYTRVHFESSGR